MKISKMWEDKDKKDIRAVCFYNWDTKSFIIEVNKEQLIKKESFIKKDWAPPSFGMSSEDLFMSNEIAEKLAQEIEKELGI